MNKEQVSTLVKKVEAVRSNLRHGIRITIDPNYFLWDDDRFRCMDKPMGQIYFCTESFPLEGEPDEGLDCFGTLSPEEVFQKASDAIDMIANFK